MNILLKVLRIVIGILMFLFFLNLMPIFGFENDLVTAFVGFSIFITLHIPIFATMVNNFVIFMYPFLKTINMTGTGTIFQVSIGLLNALSLLIYILVLFIIYKILSKNYDKNSN